VVFLSSCSDFTLPLPQVESVKEQSADQFKRILQLEEKERLLVKVEAQVENYKKQVAQLEEQVLAEQRNTDRLEFESNKLREERDRLTVDKQVWQWGGGERSQQYNIGDQISPLPEPTSRKSPTSTTSR